MPSSDAATVEKEAGSSNGDAGKPANEQVDVMQGETLRAAAAHGQMATDMYEHLHSILKQNSIDGC